MVEIKAEQLGMGGCDDEQTIYQNRVSRNWIPLHCRSKHCAG
jgi:hypothetical protein